MLKHVLAVIEDNRNLFFWNVRFFVSSLYCHRTKKLWFFFSLQVEIDGLLVSSSSKEMLGDKAIGWMLSFSWLFMWLCEWYQWIKSWILWLLLKIHDLHNLTFIPPNVNSFITRDPATYDHWLAASGYYQETISSQWELEVSIIKNSVTESAKSPCAL